MSHLIHIVSDKCTGCGICVDICPYRLISLEQDKAVVDNKECFLCGHCRAVCPTRAVEIQTLKESIALENVQISREDDVPGRISSTDLIALIDSRRSCRNYKTTRVSESLLCDLTRIGTLAPSGTNCQPWEFTVLPEREDVLGLGSLVADYYRNLNSLAARPLLRNFLKMIGKESLWNYHKKYYESVSAALDEWDKDKIDRLFHGATAVIIVSAKKDASCPHEDALLATQNILLAAESIGLGSCLIGFAVEAILRSTKLKRKIGIPDDEQVYSVIGLGYPAVKYLRSAGRRQIRPRIVKLTD